MFASWFQTFLTFLLLPASAAILSCRYVYLFSFSFFDEEIPFCFSLLFISVCNQFMNSLFDYWCSTWKQIFAQVLLLLHIEQMFGDLNIHLRSHEVVEVAIVHHITNEDLSMLVVMKRIKQTTIFEPYLYFLFTCWSFFIFIGLGFNMLWDIIVKKSKILLLKHDYFAKTGKVAQAHHHPRMKQLWRKKWRS